MINSIESLLSDVDLGDNPVSDTYSQVSLQKKYSPLDFIFEEIRKNHDKRLLEDAKHEIYPGQYQTLSLDETAKTSGVANCIAVLVFEKDRYTLGHFSALDLNPLAINSSFMKMTKEIYDRNRKDFSDLEIYVIGGTMYTKKSFPTMATDEGIRASTGAVNKTTEKNREYVSSTITYISPVSSTITYNSPDLKHYTLRGEREEKVKIEWLKPDTSADIGFCKDLGHNRVVTQRGDYPVITDPMQLELLKH